MEIDARRFFKNLDFENMAYFYHITGAGNGELISEDGLFMKEHDLRTTTIRISADMLLDSDAFIKSEKGYNLRDASEMVIIGCYKDDVDDLVQINSDDNSIVWTDESSSVYVIPSEFIIGYIDMKERDSDFKIRLNSNFMGEIDIAEDFEECRSKKI